MFYSQDILQRRGGKFGLIWIAATHPKRLTRRDYARVNVKTTSKSLLNFILVQVPPRRPGGHCPRLSLYLSAQLMYGVVRCHCKQVEFLLGDVVDFLGRIRLLAAASSTGDIDLKASFRSDQVTEMDIAAVSGIRDVAFDPYFGLLDKEDITIQLADVEGWRVHSMIEQSSSPSTVLDVDLPTTPKLKKDLIEESFKPVVGSPHTVSSPDDIKMKEVLHQIPDIEIPGIQELPGLDGEDLKLPEAPPEADILLEQLLSPKRKQLSEIEPLLPEEKTPALRPEDGIPPPRRAPPSPGVTPAPVRSIRRKRLSLTMELAPVTPSPLSRRRRKQLLFADNETQIPKKKIREQLLTGSDTCMPFILPDPRPSTVEELFSRPGGKALMYPKLFPLWKRNANVGEISETESEKNTPIWTVPELSADKSVTGIELLGSPRSKEPRLEEELPVVALEGSMEIARAAEISDIEITRTRSHTSMEGIHRGGETPVSMEIPHSTSRDQSLGDQSIDTLDESLRPRPASREVPSSEDEINLEAHQVQESVSIGDLGSLYVVPEEKEDVLSPVLARVLELSHIASSMEVLRLISSKMESGPVTTFRDICPTSNTRPCAAHLFSELLELCKSCHVNVQQEEPFGDIFISRGAEWETT
ncbi:meiotic recombination protein REC8 homolog [Gigantopelta aegis]|uniref:meiotic recombination protein REC8 homolog n=1 Tax=Gigantopelta aegis TaxID=1735272 RepID=UPI001B888D83|nr:meiotic recombination protein REC8 homolog [Gigantopelta aegis]